ncbi:uncharacterized protein RAG0_14402 [Rhynchosporium agropyri]|uniref:IBR domain-containing protein n=1 Tax=Rhynchosporium agropyri TaxID=914238 RepID=A0A1E1LGX1_9HELO|nr:uncharacterized protein RAG0_14402 [Rhynchosporium agropyri]
MFFDDIDDASARLIVQLQLEDSEEITASVLNGQSGSGVQAGEQSGLLAALMLKEDMQRNEAFLQDRGTAITLGMETTSTSRTRLEDDGAPAQVRFLETETAAEPSATPAILSQPRIQLPVHPTSPLDRVPCTICQDEFPARDLAKLPCGDEYCFTCLVQTFTQSFRDEELYPPRCCQRTIPLRALRTRLTLDITATFLAKEEEFGGKNRVYCSGRGCETFLTADMTVSPDIPKCWTCQAETCVKCKTVAHAGDCPKDEAADQLRALAESEGWKSCPGYAPAKPSSVISVVLIRGKLASARSGKRIYFSTAPTTSCRHKTERTASKDLQLLQMLYKWPTNSTLTTIAIIPAGKAYTEKMTAACVTKPGLSLSTDASSARF